MTTFVREDRDRFGRVVHVHEDARELHFQVFKASGAKAFRLSFPLGHAHADAMRSLEKMLDDELTTAQPELVHELRAESTLPVLQARSRWGRWSGALLLVLVALGTTLAWWLKQRSP
jgi:ferric-dicitrate binding protein FerR (iron transport regulator)